MVGLDIFFATFLALKIVFMLFVVYKLVDCGRLKISYFSPDGVGGLKHLTNMLMYLSWLAFVFGLFVFASLYFHWNLREYRTKDFSLVGMYILFVILAVVPLGKLEYKLSREHDAQIELVKSAKAPGSEFGRHRRLRKGRRRVARLERLGVESRYFGESRSAARLSIYRRALSSAWAGPARFPNCPSPA